MVNVVAVVVAAEVAFGYYCCYWASARDALEQVEQRIDAVVVVAAVDQDVLGTVAVALVLAFDCT